MPRVPAVTGPSVTEQAAPNAYQSSIASPDLLGASARQGQALGDAAVGSGVQIQAARNEALAQANALRVDDAINQVQEAANRLTEDPNNGFKSQTGFAAVSRPSGLPLADEYTGKLRDQANQIAGTLSNDQQRALFAAKVNNVLTTFNKGALEHERTQYQDYGLSVKDAMVTNAKSTLALNPTDPQNVAQQTTRIRAAFEGGTDDQGNYIPGSAQMQGKSAAWAKEQADAAVSGAHGNAIKLMLESGNVNGAMLYFNKYAPQMVANDVLEVQGKLKNDYDTRLGMTVGNQVFDGAQPQLQPNDFNRLQSLVMDQESGGRRYAANGTLLTSTKGARGEMQVMPATARDPGYGVTPAKDDSPQELARVGHDYLAAMVVRYQGDVQKALAAYNAGPGAVDKAVDQAGQGLRTGSDWRAYLPKETRDYVTAISAKFGDGGGVPAKPTLAQLQDQTRAQLGPAASSMAVKTAIEQVTQRFNADQAATAQRADETVKRAMQALEQNGGNYGALPFSVRSDLTQYAPDKVDDVLKYGKRIAEGTDVTNPALYLRLSDPNTLRNVTEPQLYALRSQLSTQDYAHFADERNKLLNPTDSTGPGDLNSSAIKNTLDARLRELKIDPTPKDGGDDAARVGAIRRYVDEQVLAAQRAASKKFNDAETTAQIDRLFAQSGQLKGWLGAYTAPALAAPPGDIPSPIRDQIKAAFKKQGVQDPTDAQVLNAWLHWNAAQPKK